MVFKRFIWKKKKIHLRKKLGFTLFPETKTDSACLLCLFSHPGLRTGGVAAGERRGLGPRSARRAPGGQAARGGVGRGEEATAAWPAGQNSRREVGGFFR